MDSANETQLQLQELVSSFSLENNDQIRSGLDDLERSFFLVDDKTITDKSLDDLVAGFEVAPQKESTEESMDNLFKTFFIDEEEQNAINHEIDLLVESFYIKDGTQQALDDLVSSFEVKKNPNEVWPGFPVVTGTDATTELTPKTLNFQELAEKLADKENRMIFIRAISETIIEVSPGDANNVYERLEEAVKAKLAGKIDYYAETRVIGLFDKLREATPDKYGQLMDVLESVGLTENLLNSFVEDTMMNEENENNLNLYISTNKTGDVLGMYQGFLSDLEKTKKDGKYDLKQLSPLALYLLTLASTRMVERAKTREESAEYEKTIIQDPSDVVRVNLAAEAIQKLSKEERKELFALQGKIQRGETLSEKDEELKEKHKAILEVEQSIPLPVEEETEEAIEPPTSTEKPIGGMTPDELKAKSEELIETIKTKGVTDESLQQLASIYMISKNHEDQENLVDALSKTIAPDKMAEFWEKIRPPQPYVPPEEKGRVREAIDRFFWRRDSKDALQGEDGKRKLNKRVWVALAGLAAVGILLFGAKTPSQAQLQPEIDNAPSPIGEVVPLNPAQPVVDFMKPINDQLSQAEATVTRVNEAINQANEAKQQWQSNPQPPTTPETPEAPKTEVIEVKIGHESGEYATAGDAAHGAFDLSGKFKEKIYKFGALWTAKYSADFWNKLAEANGIAKGSEAKPWENFNLLKEGQPLNFTPQVLEAAGVMFE